MTTRRVTVGSALALVAASAVLAALWTVRQPAFAQAPTAAAPESPEEAAAKAAFQALPEADRKAIQDALVWSGDYAGVSDGAFGKGTLAAIKAYQARAKAKVDGILSPPTRSALLAEGAKARQAAGFAVADDPKSGIRIGVPFKLLDQRAAGKSGAIFKAKDNSASLEAFTEDASKTTLPDLFQRSVGDTSKHITYKVLRPEFFVVTGDAGGKRFFSRVAGGPAGIRGFIFSFPPQPAFDRISVAIANSFIPFPEAAKPAAPGPAVVTPPPLPHPVIQLSGLAVGPKQILTALLPESCTAPSVGGSQAKVLRSDATSGLALLERSGPDAQAAAMTLRASEMQQGEAVIVLSSTADGEANVAVASGEAPSASRIVAPLQAPSGSLVFDRSGALAGLVTFQANVKRLPGGVVPEASYTIVVAGAIKTFLAAANLPLKAADPSGAGTSAGEVAARYAHALVSVHCGG